MTSIPTGLQPRFGEDLKDKIARIKAERAKKQAAAPATQPEATDELILREILDPTYQDPELKAAEQARRAELEKNWETNQGSYREQLAEIKLETPERGTLDGTALLGFLRNEAENGRPYIDDLPATLGVTEGPLKKALFALKKACFIRTEVITDPRQSEKFTPAWIFKLDVLAEKALQAQE